MVVTASRTPMRIDATLADVTVIDRAQIERTAGRTLPELLAREAGVQTWSNGGAGQFSSVSLRGLDARHVLLLIDGVRYGSALTGTPIWDNIPLESIERIEIVRGPLSGLYGSDAVAGVVQVFTRRGEQGQQSTAALTVGSNGTANTSAALRFGEGAFDGAFQLGNNTTQGFSATNPRAPFGAYNADRDAFRQNSGSARLGWRFAEGWRAEANLLGSRATNHYDDGPDVDTRARLRSTVVGFLVSGAVGPDWSTTIRLSQSSDANTTLATASPYTGLGTFGTSQQQMAWENRWGTPVGTLLVLAEQLHQQVETPPDTSFDVAQRTIRSLATGLNGQADAHSWQANVRHDENSQFGNQTTGSLGYGYAVTRAWRAAASFGSSFTAPNFSDLYYPGFSNPQLLPEEGKHREFSLRWTGTASQWRFAYFDNRLRGYISSAPTPVNIPRVRADGFSLKGSTDWSGWALSAVADHTNPRNETAGEEYGKLLPRRSRNTMKLAADTRLGAVQVGASLLAVGHSFDDVANTQRVAGFGSLDLRADWVFERDWTLGLRLNNLADKRYETVYGYNQPGRQVFLALRYRAR